jgi:hypothetical protein
MKREAIHLSFRADSDLWNSRTFRETNSPATRSHPDLSESHTTARQFLNGVSLAGKPQYMHHTKFVNLKHYNLMSNSLQNQ